MSEKEYECGCKVTVGEHIVALHHNGEFFTNSNVDYYYDEERGYGCNSPEEVADQYHQNFCWIENAIEAIGTDVMLDAMPNNCGGRLQLRDAIAKAKGE